MNESCHDPEAFSRVVRVPVNRDPWREMPQEIIDAINAEWPPELVAAINCSDLVFTVSTGY